MSDIFFIIGWLMAVVGAFWLLVEQFKTGVIWGLACFFIPIVSLIWVILHFEKGWKPFVLALGGVFVVCAVMMLNH